MMWRQLCTALLVGALGGTVLAVPTAVHAQETPVNEYQIKAVFLFHFAQFVTWPPAAFDDAHAPLVIGVLGDDPFGSYLDETVRGESVNGHPLVVRHIQHVRDATRCQIVFVDRNDGSDARRVAVTLHGHRVLTVSDAADFAERGGVIQFVTIQHKIHLHINLEAAKAARLTISSNLLRASTIVRSDSSAGAH